MSTNLTEAQLRIWHTDRARQALIGTDFNTHKYRSPYTRGDFMQLINQGIALRTYRSAKESR